MNIMISVYIFADIHMYICIFTYAFSHMYANVCIIIVFHRGNTLEHHFWASQLWHRSVHSRICFEPQQTLQEGPPATSPSEVPKLMGSQHFWSRSPNYFDVPQTSQSLRARSMTSKFRMFNLCVLKRIQWSAGALEVSWTSCSMLGGLSLAQSWYLYMLGPKWCVECSNVTAFMIQLVQSNQQVPPHPKIQKSVRECTMTQIPCEVFPSHAAVFPSSPSKFPPQFQK